MDLDAKSTQLRQWETILRQQGDQLKDHHSRGELLQEEVRDKTQRVNELTAELEQQGVVNQLLESGIQKINDNLEDKEKFVSGLKGLEELKRKEMADLKEKLENLHITLDGDFKHKNSEINRLKETVKNIKSELLSTVDKLVKQTKVSEQLRVDYESALEKLKAAEAKVKELEDTVDTRDRDIDIIKDFHSKEAHNFVDQVSELKKRTERI